MTLQFKPVNGINSKYWLVPILFRIILSLNNTFVFCANSANKFTINTDDYEQTLIIFKKSFDNFPTWIWLKIRQFLNIFNSAKKLEWAGFFFFFPLSADRKVGRTSSAKYICRESRQIEDKTRLWRTSETFINHIGTLYITIQKIAYTTYMHISSP